MSAELAYRIRAEGAEELQKIVASIKASDDAVKKASAGLREFDQSSQKAAAGAEKYITSLERQAEMAGKSRTQQLLLKQTFDTADYARTAAEAGRISAAYSKLIDTQQKAAESTGATAASFGLSIGLWQQGIQLAQDLAVGTFNAVRGLGQMAEAQQNVAARTGLTVREVGLFEAAAEDAGVGAGAYTAAMRTLSHALSDNGDVGKTAKRALSDLHVEVRNGFGALKPMGEIWLDLADAIGRTEDPAKRAQYAIDILGRGALEILPQLTGEFRKTLEEYRKMGVGFDEAGLKIAKDVDKNFDDLLRKVKNFGKEFALVAAGAVGFGEKFDFKKNKARLEAEERDRQTELNGGTLTLDLKQPVVKTTTIEDLLATKRLSTAQRINAALGQQETLEDKLREATKDRAEAARIGNEESFALLNREVKSLEARIAGEKRYKEAQVERAREEKRWESELARLFTASQNARDRALDKSIEKQGEGALKLREEIALRGELLQLELTTLAASDRILGTSAAQRLASQTPGRNAAFAGGIFGADVEEGKKLLDLEREHRLRMIELTAGPGGELAAARQVAELRIASATSELEKQEARVQYEERVAQIQQQALQKYRDDAGKVYDALSQKGSTGVLDLIRGQGDIFKRQLFVNASSSVFQSAGSTLGKIGEASGLGSLLRGTIFDPANAGTPIDKNSTALGRVEKSLNALNGTLSGVPAVLGGDGTYATPGGVLQGGTGLIMSLLGKGKGKRDQSVADFVGEFYDQPGGGASSLTRNQRLLGGIGSGAAAAYGAYSGIRSGGVGGGLQAAGSIAGGIGGILGTLGKASGGSGTPWGAILQGAGLAMSILGPLFGGNKAQKYEDQQNAQLNAARYAAPTGRNAETDRYGNATDYDYRGNVRVIERPVYVKIDALDARSITDRRQDIASAIRDAIREGSDLSDTVRGLTMLPA